MGVYLPKVDMPIGDETITVQICPDGSIWQRFRGTVPGVKAVPVPPHGRLVDEEHICGDLRPLIENPYCYNRKQIISETLAHCLRIISDAPTVIEAEEAPDGRHHGAAADGQPHHEGGSSP